MKSGVKLMEVNREVKMKLTESKLRQIIREVIREGFAGPLSKTKQKKFETDRRKGSEVLGFKATGKPDVKTSESASRLAWQGPLD